MFNKQYFIEKFSKIPDEDIGYGSLANHCALYHCGVRNGVVDGKIDYVATEESTALALLLSGGKDSGPGVVWRVNDRGDGCFTPKERILNALAQLPD